MQARSALFDVYGDHLRRRGGTAPVASLIRLLGALDIAPPAVRTAISRMVRQGWLAASSTPEGPGYRLTPQAERRLDDAYDRIYRTGQHSASQGWDGRWHVLVAQRPATRSARDRIGSGLSFLGYAPLTAGTWIAPRAHPDAPAVLEAEGVRAETFQAAHEGDGAVLAGRAWDLAAVAAAYERFEVTAAARLDGLRSRVTADPEAGPDAGPEADRAAFATRSELVHEWRKFLFLDPGLPDAVLPSAWPGHRAARLFDQLAGELLPAASRYVDGCLGRPTPEEDP